MVIPGVALRANKRRIRLSAFLLQQLFNSRREFRRPLKSTTDPRKAVLVCGREPPRSCASGRHNAFEHRHAAVYYIRNLSNGNVDPWSCPIKHSRPTPERRTRAEIKTIRRCLVSVNGIETQWRASSFVYPLSGMFTVLRYGICLFGEFSMLIRIANKRTLSEGEKGEIE